jgi:hypothetical protein
MQVSCWQTGLRYTRAGGGSMIVVTDAGAGLRMPSVAAPGHTRSPWRAAITIPNDV